MRRCSHTVDRSEGYFAFPASTQRAQVVFAFFGQEDEYFPPAQNAMINLQVDDLDGVLDRLIEAKPNGIAVGVKRCVYRMLASHIHSRATKLKQQALTPIGCVR